MNIPPSTRTNSTTAPAHAAAPSSTAITSISTASKGLHCVRADTGKPVWKLDVNKEFNVIQNFFGVGSTPVIEGDLLIAQVGGSPEGSKQRQLFDQSLKGNGSGVVAFNKLTGKVVYKISDELASYSGPVLATINDRRYCFVFARGGLLAFNPANGKVDFNFPWRCRRCRKRQRQQSRRRSQPRLPLRNLWPRHRPVEHQTGRLRGCWKESAKFKKSMQCHWMTPIFHDGYLYGCSGRHTNNAELRCIELETGKLMWTEKRLTRTSLLMIDGHFICLGEFGTLSLLKVNPKKYEEVSSIELKEERSGRPLLRYPCWAAPIVSHGLLYVRGEGRLVCLELIPQKK